MIFEAVFIPVHSKLVSISDSLKPFHSAITEKAKKLVSSMPVRPNVSATLPKKISNTPEVKLLLMSVVGSESLGARSSHNEEAIIHVNWAVDTRILPWRKLGIDMLIDAIRTKRISWTKERKAGERVLGSNTTSLGIASP